MDVTSRFVLIAEIAIPIILYIWVAWIFIYVLFATIKSLLSIMIKRISEDAFLWSWTLDKKSRTCYIRSECPSLVDTHLETGSGSR